MPVEFSSSQFSVFLRELEQRHLADLRFSDVTRALRALSSAYVERRESALAGRKALDGAGKRAAFALYYGPIHSLLIQHIARELAIAPAKGTVVDLGCGTGVAGAAVACTGAPVLGIDTHPWALDEARFTYRAFGLQHDVRRGHAARVRFPADTACIVAAFVVNELNDSDRAVLLDDILRLKARTHTASVLIVEPIFHSNLAVVAGMGEGVSRAGRTKRRVARARGTAADGDAAREGRRPPAADTHRAQLAPLSRLRRAR